MAERSLRFARLARDGCDSIPVISSAERAGDEFPVMEKIAAVLEIPWLAVMNRGGNALVRAIAEGALGAAEAVMTELEALRCAAERPRSRAARSRSPPLSA